MGSIHDIQVAYYKIHQENDNLLIEFVFEENDILNTMNELEIDFSNENIQKYITNNFSLIINSQQQSIKFESVENKHKHIYLAGTIAEKAQRIYTIDIDNTCLLNIGNQSNIVEIRLNEKRRDFLMNLERTSIQISY